MKSNRPASPARGMGQALRPKVIWGLLKETAAEWSEDKAPRLGAALAYYTAFSLTPLLIIVIAIAGLVFGQEAAQGQIMQQLEGLLGPEGAAFVSTALEGARRPAEGILATVVGTVTLLLGALGVFGQLQEALNTIWEVTPKPGRGLWGMLRDRLLSLTMVLGTSFLLLVSLVVSAALSALSNFFSGLGATAVLAGVLNFVVSFASITLLFALLFKYLPDARIAWSDVWIGAALTSLLFTIGKSLIGLYLGNASFGSTYGAAGSLVVLLVWLYYSSQILFFGAEFTQVYANRFGSRVVPEADAERLSETARIKQGIPHRREPAPARGTAAFRPTAPRGPYRIEVEAPLGRGHSMMAAVASFVAGLSAGVLMALRTLRRRARR